MLIFNKTKLLIALGAVMGGSLLVSLLSDETSKQTNIMETGGKLDFIEDKLCRDINGNIDPRGYFRATPSAVSFQIGHNVFNSSALKIFSALDLNNKTDIYQSYQWNEFIKAFNLNAFEVEELKRKNKLPDDFIKVVENSKAYMEKLYGLEKISLKNVIAGTHVTYHPARYDIKNERLIIELRYKNLADKFFDGNVIDQNSYLFIDVPFDEMKKITTDPDSSAYAFHLSFEQVEKGKVTNNKFVQSSYTLKFISPEMNVMKGYIPFKSKRGTNTEMSIYSDCGEYLYLYDNEDKAVPISKGMLGTIKIKNPRLCTDEYTHCKELTISDSF